MRYITAFMPILLLISACATQEQKLSRADWLAMTSRTYLQKTEDEVINKVQKIFELADPNDVTFTHFKNGITVERNMLFFAVVVAVSGHYKWVIEVKEENSASLVTAYAYANLNSTTAVQTGPSSVAPYSTSSNAGAALQGRALYNLFWSRLDFLLGIENSEWLTCSQMAEKTGASTFGELEALCLNADDLSPKREKANN